MKHHSRTSSRVRVLEAQSAAVPMAAAVDNRVLDRRGTLSSEHRASSSAYSVRFAQCKTERDAIFRLRFAVFNLELKEGLESAYLNGKDKDAFDDVCDHLLVEHHATGRVIGTYRLQTGRVATEKLGFYSEREFDFSPYAGIRDSFVELGRACIHPEHRSFEVLTLLWRAVAHYAVDHNARYLIGCSSLNSQSAEEGSNVYWRLQQFLVETHLRTNPQPRFRIPLLPFDATAPCINPPRLLRAYLSIGAQICGEPALDRDFKTIDFLTLLDLNNLASPMRARFLDR